MADPEWRIPQLPVAEMHTPVRCMHCSAVYCLERVKVTGRFSDCTVWTSPCCGHPGIDDRPWLRDRHYQELPRGGVEHVDYYDVFGLRRRGLRRRG